RDPAGTGLGLYLARRLAARCGAALELRESSPAGSTFTVHLRTGEAEPGSGAEHTPGVAADPR
ncbi:MAG TPA: ATP-binding protein, partial [Rugosimonospora sp.]|nr:ATP-binding protein [Rugosimonospora sp.]